MRGAPRQGNAGRMASPKGEGGMTVRGRGNSRRKEGLSGMEESKKSEKKGGENLTRQVNHSFREPVGKTKKKVRETDRTRKE